MFLKENENKSKEIKPSIQVWINDENEERKTHWYSKTNQVALTHTETRARAHTHARTSSNTITTKQTKCARQRKRDKNFD